MIPAKELDLQFIKRAYNRRSWVYSKTVAPLEWDITLPQSKKPGSNQAKKYWKLQ
jgi:hypothetical protein